MVFKNVIIENFLTLYVVETKDGFLAGVNHIMEETSWATQGQAKRSAELLAMRTMNLAQAILQRPITAPNGYRWEKVDD